MTVAEPAPGHLTIRFDLTPGMTGALEPLGGNRFRTRWIDRNIEDALVDFAADGGAVRGATMKAISPLADFSFDYQDLHFTTQVTAQPSEAARTGSRAVASDGDIRSRRTSSATHRRRH